MALIDWDEQKLGVGLELIDDAHHEFIDMVNRLETTPKAEFKDLYSKLCDHIKSHFDDENRLMDESQFPARAEHQAEHRRVLTELGQFKTRVDRGMVQFGQAYVKERLPEWFVLHTQTMDSALVAHLNRQASKQA